MIGTEARTGSFSSTPELRRTPATIIRMVDSTRAVEITVAATAVVATVAVAIAVDEIARMPLNRCNRAAGADGVGRATAHAPPRKKLISRWIQTSSSAGDPGCLISRGRAMSRRRSGALFTSSSLRRVIRRSRSRPAALSEVLVRPPRLVGAALRDRQKCWVGEFEIPFAEILANSDALGTATQPGSLDVSSPPR